MKKILLATTLLVATTGFAAAEVKFSGTAAMGIARDGEVSDDSLDAEIHAYSNANLAVEFVGETDSGLTFGATFDVSVGTSYSFADDEGFNFEGGSFGAPEVYVSGAYGRLAMTVADGVGDYAAYHEDDVAGYDLEYTHTMDAFNIGLRADVDGDAVDGDYSATLGYSADPFSAKANIDGDGDWDLEASYVMGSITVTAATDHDSVSSLKLAYAANGISASVKADTDSAWEVAAGYEANGLTIGVSTDDASAWEATASYDLGGGASLEGGMNYNDDAYVGVALSF